MQLISLITSININMGLVIVFTLITGLVVTELGSKLSLKIH